MNGIRIMFCSLKKALFKEDVKNVILSFVRGPKSVSFPCPRRALTLLMSGSEV